MNTLFKKYFWAIKLVGAALLALVAAGVISDILAGKFFVLPAARFGSGKDLAGAGAGDLGRVAKSEDAAKELERRRVFRLDQPAAAADTDASKDDTVKVATADAAPASDDLTESTLPINLVGTFVSSIPDFSYATLQVEGDQKIASLGSEYLDGKAKVVKIARNHIVLQEDARYTYVKLWGTKQPQTPGAPGSNPLTQGMGKTPPPAPKPPDAGGDVADAGGDAAMDGVKKTGAYDYQIDRSMLDKQLADLSKLQSEARVVPHYQDNQYEGFKLVGVRPGSLYRAIGIRSGDVITSVNGTKIDSPNKALELFDQLKSSSNISVEIERRGQPKTLSYSIQ